MDYQEKEELQLRKDAKGIFKWISICILIIFAIIVLGMIGCPRYNVYSSRMDGEAKLAHAQASKEIAVADAKAKMESASLLSRADTIRAHGIAKSNAIIGQSLKSNKEYLDWLWIDNLNNTTNRVIYIPTEANIPIMEAGKR